ncbi:hypothetical protein NPIL_302491 [Nephila pilipes]|uniref:Integrase catalytic domain-containing protein n=1 Tax=Nephila pilipes TaxID=299642 RepID=A0A8X6QEP1_NEPPI|nr:hypothetical protein NPIL_302491 [Nephila pilipes]
MGNDPCSNSSNIEGPGLNQLFAVSLKPPPFWINTPGFFDEVHLDITGPLPSSAVYNGCIFRFGALSVVITDQGSQFESNLFMELSRLVIIKGKDTMAYNPECNGFVKRRQRPLAMYVHSGPECYLRFF